MKSAHFNLQIPVGCEVSVREEVMWGKTQSVLVIV